MSSTFKTSTLRASTAVWKLSGLFFAWILILDLGAQSFDSCWQPKVSGDEASGSDRSKIFEQGAFGKSGLYQIKSYEISDSNLEDPITISTIVSDRLAEYQNGLHSEIEKGSIRLVVDPATKIDTQPALSEARILTLFMNPPFGCSQEHLFYFLEEEKRILSIEIILGYTRCPCVEKLDEAVEWKIGELRKNEDL